MSTVSEEIEEYAEEYRAGDNTTKNERRTHALILYFKWKAIKEKVRAIDLEDDEYVHICS